MKYWFIYKLIQSNQGKMMPPPPGGHLPECKVELGLKEFNGWYLGNCDDLLYIDDILEYQPAIITESQAQGFLLLGITQLFAENGNPMNPEYRDLTEEELALQSEAKKMEDMFNLRYDITQAVGDYGNIISDLNRKVSLLERIVFTFILNPTDTKLQETYIPMIQEYFSKLSDSTFKDSIDFEAHPELFNKLKTRDTAYVDVLLAYAYKQMQE
jgi:hypothetical protein